MSSNGASFDIKGCEVRYYGPHQAIPGRVTGIVRVIVEESFRGNVSRYPLDLKVKADVGNVPTEQVRTALLSHAAHQLNRLKARHTDVLPAAAE
ncbi:MAG: hypothetical protein P0Y65_06095 [Candidatus Devosia phytovorans]|uniref:Uncharacterized protein n=1 Tax=Candidatus Devosia phytovorans TaxID=3121372 RepID=A0AAJ5VYF1_9HYPH|nr:hypothetical protein [Devosia sp.]WEK05823.1 MAG: hypothetical protein P0Y65_06095 [Devosia sp.]